MTVITTISSDLAVKIFCVLKIATSRYLKNFVGIQKILLMGAFCTHHFVYRN